MKTLAIGIPSNGEMKSEMVASLIPALFYTSIVRHGFGLMCPTTCLVHEGRNVIAEEALKGDYDYLMFVDSDMVFGADAIQTLLSRNKDVIGANYNKRGKLPVESTVRYDGVLPKVPFVCEGIATGFMLVNVDVFRKIEKPWFFFEQLEGNNFLGEDYWFCEKVKNAGMEVWCDPTIQVEHLGLYKY